jgi:hypothetical protein
LNSVGRMISAPGPIRAWSNGDRTNGSGFGTY